MKARLAGALLSMTCWAGAAWAQQPAVGVDGGATGPATPLAMPPANPLALPPAPPPPTIITPDRNTPLDLGTQVTQAGNLYLIDGGTRAGANLFHSFSRFDLGQGDFARWVLSTGDPAQIRNVVNRVTGGDPSDIYGTIDSNGLPNATFWFVNPAGIVFGQGASINVPAAAHFTTAQELRFADGTAFTMSTPSGSTLSIASPAAFGFLGGQGDVVMRDLDNVPFTGTRLSLTGRNVAVVNSQIGADGFALAAVGSGPAELSLQAPRATSGDGQLTVQRSVMRSRGSDGILLSGGTVDLGGSDIGTAFSPGPFSGVGGPIDISGRDVTIFSTLVSASTSGAEDAGAIRITGNAITIAGISMIQSETDRGSTGAAGEIRIIGDTIDIIERSRVSSSTLSAQDSGPILLQAGRIRIDTGTVATDVRSGARGNAGLITIRGGALELTHGGTLSSASDGFGDAGVVDAQLTDSIRLTRGSIVSEANGATGRSGLILLTAPQVVLDDLSIISTRTGTAGEAGIIGINSDDLQLLGSSIVESTSEAGAAGNAGLVFIQRLGEQGGRLLLTGGSAIRSDTNGSGNAGGIFIAMDDITMRNGGRISSDAGRECALAGCGALGAAGNISIFGTNVTMTDADPFDEFETRISSDSVGGGNGGEIMLALDGSLMIDGAAQISSDTTGDGHGGNIIVDARDIRLSGRGAFISATTFGPGQGGSVTLDAQDGIRIEDEAAVLTQSGDGRTAGHAPPGQGSSGAIALTAREIVVTTGGGVSASSFTDGNAGTISVDADRLEVSDVGSIRSSTQGPGRGGSIDIDVGELVMRGIAFIDTDSLSSCSGDDCLPGGGGGDIRISADRIEMIGSSGDFLDTPIISSDTDSDGAAGNVIIDVTGPLIMDLARISSATTGAGAAGLVRITAGSLEMRSDATISTSSSPFGALPRTGNAGEVVIAAGGPISIGEGSAILSNTTGAGNAGQVTVTTPGKLLINGGRISSGSTPGSTGRSGRVTISADALLVNGSGGVETVSRNAQPAGTITITARNIRLSGPDAGIASSNADPGTGDAGSVTITTDNLALLEGARIGSSSAQGAAGNVTINMPSTGLLRIESAGEPSFISTSSGPGRGGRITISAPRAIISNGGSILALGELGGANVLLSSDYFIASTDRTNRLAVSGNIIFDSSAYDVSSGTVNRDLSVIDASGVLRGQCATVRETGEASQLVVRPIGPYGLAPLSLAPAVPDRTAAAGAGTALAGCS